MSCKATYNPNGGEIENIESLLTRAHELSESPGLTYFRGQARAAWGLRPSIGRLDIEYGGRVLTRYTPDDERNLLHRFRRHTYSHLNRLLNEWEALFLARHHYLPVRVLDWSSNPLVALYAACWERDYIGQDGSIWGIRRIVSENNDLNVFNSSPSPLEVNGLKILYPFYGSPRMAAQSAVFTVQDDPWRDMESYFPCSLPDKDFDVAELVRFVVPASAKPECIDDLERLGINHRTLYPDLDGVAQGLWHTVVLRGGIKNKKMKTKLKMIYWKGEKFWVGKLFEHPEIMTQGETLEELEENMKDAYMLMTMEDVPEEHNVKELTLAEAVELTEDEKEGHSPENRVS